jgi:hypothetical protein
MLSFPRSLTYQVADPQVSQVPPYETFEVVAFGML